MSHTSESSDLNSLIVINRALDANTRKTRTIQYRTVQDFNAAYGLSYNFTDADKSNSLWDQASLSHFEQQEGHLPQTIAVRVDLSRLYLTLIADFYQGDLSKRIRHYASTYSRSPDWELGIIEIALSHKDFEKKYRADGPTTEQSEKQQEKMREMMQKIEKEQGPAESSYFARAIATLFSWATLGWYQ